MAMFDLGVHLSTHADEATVQLRTAKSSTWVDLIDKNQVELTFFVETQEQGEALVAGFVACGVRRIVSEDSTGDAIQNEDCGTAQSTAKIEP